MKIEYRVRCIVFRPSDEIKTNRDGLLDCSDDMRPGLASSRAGRAANGKSRTSRAKVLARSARRNIPKIGSLTSEPSEPSCALARNFARSARSLPARDARQYFILVSPIQVIESCSIHLRGLSVKNLILYATKSSTLTFAFLFEVTNL